MWEAGLESYRAYVASLAAGEKEGVCLNRGPDHAAIIMEHLFRVATDNVQILTGRLNEQVYGVRPVVMAAVEFLRKNPSARLSILAEQPIDVGAHPLLREINEQGFSNRVQISRVPEIVQRMYKFHFAVADGKHFRLEESRTSFEAYAQFQNPKLGNVMSTVFSVLGGASASASASELVTL